MPVSGRFITLHDSRKGKCHLVLCFWGHSLSPSHRANAALVSLESDEPEFHSSESKLLSATRNHPLHRAYSAIVLYHYISSGLTSLFTLWESDKRWANIQAWACVLVCMFVCVGGCVCGKMEQRGSWGIQSLTQRSRDRRADMLQAQNNPDGIHEWNDRITGVLENLLRWLIMLFMVGRHTASSKRVKLFD